MNQLKNRTMKNPVETFRTLSAIILFTVICLVAGCYGEGTEEVTDNKDYHVTYLFTVDSNKVYRFFDGSHPHYIVIGPGTIQTNGEYGSGSSYQAEEINTMPKGKKWK